MSVEIINTASIHKVRRQPRKITMYIWWLIFLPLLTVSSAYNYGPKARIGRHVQSLTESDIALIQDIEALLLDILYIEDEFSTPLPAFNSSGNILPFSNTSGINTNYSSLNTSNTNSTQYTDINNVCASTASNNINVCNLKRPSFAECSACGTAVKLPEGTESGPGWGGIIWIQYLTSNNVIASSCSGWLIEPTLVATAGHCVWDIDNGGGWLIDKYTIIVYSRLNGKSDTSYATAQVVHTWAIGDFTSSSFSPDDRFQNGADLGLMKLSKAFNETPYQWMGSSGGSGFYKAYGYPAEFQYAPGYSMYYWTQNMTVGIGCSKGGGSGMFCSTIGTVGGMSGGPLFKVVGNASYVVGSMSAGSECLCRTFHTPLEGKYSIGSLVTAAGCTVNCTNSACTATCNSVQSPSSRRGLFATVLGSSK